jgi:hypothetical protein
MEGGVSVKGGIRKEGRSWRGNHSTGGTVFLLWAESREGL